MSFPAAFSSQAQGGPARGGEPGVLRDLGRCQLFTELGPFVDMGRETVDARRIQRGMEQLPLSEHSGSGFRTITERVQVPIRLDEPMESARLFVRVAGSGRVQASLGGRSLGVIRVRPGEPRILRFHVATPELSGGIHQLVFRPMRGARGRTVEIDWALIAHRAPSPGFRPPAQEVLVRSVALGGVPEQSLVLPVGARLSCPVSLDGSAHLTTRLGYIGPGQGEAGVAVRTRSGRVVLGRQRLGKEDVWKPLRANLAPYGDHAVLEFFAEGSGGSGQVAFAAPTITSNVAPPKTPRARTVVVLVAEGFDVGDVASFRRHEHLAWLLGRGVQYSGYRLSSSVIAANFATLLTGLEPWRHAVEDPGAKLGSDLQTLATRVSGRGGRAGFFTGVPNTFASFGFNSGWHSFHQFSPVQDEPASAPLARGAMWLDQVPEPGTDGLLLVVHLRGAHPPWEISRDAMDVLPPRNYSGPIQPRRGGIVLRQIDSAGGRLVAEDWERVSALRHSTLADLDAGVGLLLSVLRERGLLSDALIVLAGGVPPGSKVPFAQVGGLQEADLSAPLVVVFPGQADGAHVSGTVTTRDVEAAVRGALGLGGPALADAPSAGGEAQLLRLAMSGEVADKGRSHIAAVGDAYSVKSGTWVLSGKGKGTPQLCALHLDPACKTDRFQDEPTVAYAMWADLWQTRVAATGMAQQRPPQVASPDAATLSALTVWGQ